MMGESTAAVLLTLVILSMLLVCSESFVSNPQQHRTGRCSIIYPATTRCGHFVQKAHEVSVIGVDGEKKTVQMGDGDTILDSLENANIEAPHSCRTGLCTDCAAFVKAGLNNIKLDAAVLDPAVSARGFILTCSSSVVGPGVEMELGKHEEMYDAQYGTFRDDHEAAQKGSKNTGIPLPGFTEA
mmetsp:Transcript_5482/g.8759  ORF Transcript_5482/g.8759 Transcript_5482/m.8759 type:complete len:184 (-) Transcript_5482:9-560(-)